MKTFAGKRLNNPAGLCALCSTNEYLFIWLFEALIMLLSTNEYLFIWLFEALIMLLSRVIMVPESCFSDLIYSCTD